MWKLFHKLLGWEYVFIENGAAGYVRRVWTGPDGQPMVAAYSFQIWPLKPPYHGWQVVPLTQGVADHLRQFEQ